MKIKSVMAVAVVIAAVVVGAAQAAEAQPPEQVVDFKDLNLNSDAGIQALYKRIHGAADQVCGTVDGKDLQILQAHKACVAQATADAVATVNNQMLTQTATVTVAQAR
jgi:UrcA family protein